jgi:hypothetical protein
VPGEIAIVQPLHDDHVRADFFRSFRRELIDVSHQAIASSSFDVRVRVHHLERIVDGDAVPRKPVPLPPSESASRSPIRLVAVVALHVLVDGEAPLRLERLRYHPLVSTMRDFTESRVASCMSYERRSSASPAASATSTPATSR